MKSLLFRQAVFIPLGAMLVPILISFSLPGYSSVAQHISEVALLDHPIAMIQRISAVAAGGSILLFALGALLSPRAMPFTAIAAAAVGAGMVSNGVFVMGSPLHGLWGLALFMVLLPAFFAAEIPHSGSSRTIRSLSLLAAVLSLTYMWLMLSGLDPHNYRGLTQRIATLVIFGWYSVAGAWLLGHAGSARSPMAPEVLAAS